MNRRLLFRFAAIGGALAVLARGAGAEEPRKKQHKIVLHVGANDQDSMRNAIEHARKASELYTSRGEKASAAGQCRSTASPCNRRSGSRALPRHAIPAPCRPGKQADIPLIKPVCRTTII
jgi:hypothetical protein